MRVIIIEVSKFYEYIYNKLFSLIEEYKINFEIDYDFTPDKQIKIYCDIYVSKETDEDLDKFFDIVVKELEEKINSTLSEIKEYKTHITKEFIFIYYDKHLSKIYSKEILWTSTQSNKKKY